MREYSYRIHDGKSKLQRQADFPYLSDLLYKQTAGKIPLTREEKIRVQKYEKEQREKKKHK